MQEIINYYRFKEKFEAIVRSKPAHFISMSNQEFKKQYPHILTELKTYYKRIMCKELQTTSCSNCLIDAFFELRALNINQITNKMALLHKLKEGKVAQIKGVYYSNKSKHLTNAICEEIYNDKHCGPTYFESFDPDWKAKEKHIDIPEVEGAITSAKLHEFFNVVEAKETIEDVKEFDAEIIEEDQEQIKPDFDSMTQPQLLVYCKDNQIKLSSRKKTDILKLLKSL